MNYHISTQIIIDNFKRQSECPLCDIYGEVETRVIEQFQGEAVMLDDFRERVNRKGFCEKHFQLLGKGENKLGTALQTHTRLETLMKGLKQPKNPKAAAAEAVRVEEAISGCAVCDLIEDSMRRYYETIPKMYYGEDGFDGLFRRGKGFCLHHYACLLKNAGGAKSRAEEFLSCLTRMQRENIDRILRELDWFCDKFDYRNRERPMGTSADALPRAISKIHGKK